MATKTSSASQSSVQNRQVLWFYQSNSNQNEQIEWKRYSDFESDFIEEAFQKKEEEIAFDNCTINFKDNMQFNMNDRTQHSRVKREEVGVNDLIRKERFSYPEQPIQVKSFESKFKWNIVKKWLSKNLKVKDDYAALAELAALGILEEGRLLNKNLDAEKMANELRICVLQNKNLKSHYLVSLNNEYADDMAVKKCATHLYSTDSFLYKLVNSTLRNNDVSKLDTLGPLCYLLSKYLPFKRPDGHWEYTVYRGTSLSKEMIEEYKAAVAKKIIWPAFTSTTKCREVAEFYSDNALFIIQAGGIRSQGARDISALSKFPQEHEVLFCGGQSFVVSKVEFHSESGKYLIYMHV